MLAREPACCERGVGAASLVRLCSCCVCCVTAAARGHPPLQACTGHFHVVQADRLRTQRCIWGQGVLLNSCLPGTGSSRRTSRTCIRGTRTSILIFLAVVAPHRALLHSNRCCSWLLEPARHPADNTQTATCRPVTLAHHERMQARARPHQLSSHVIAVLNQVGSTSRPVMPTASLKQARNSMAAGLKAPGGLMF